MYATARTIGTAIKSLRLGDPALPVGDDSAGRCHSACSPWMYGRVHIAAFRRSQSGPALFGSGPQIKHSVRSRAGGGTEIADLRLRGLARAVLGVGPMR